MQKLWIISELFPPDETSTAYILGEIANALTSKYEVNVICGPEIYDKRKEKGTLAIPQGINLYRVNGIDVDKNTILGKILSFYLISLRLKNMVKSKVSPNDKVLIVTNPAPLVLYIAHLKKKIGFELHILVHDIFPENTIPAGIKLPKIVYNAIKPIFDKAYAAADQLIAIGRDMAEVLQGKVQDYSKRVKISIVENWAEVEDIHPQPFPNGRLMLQYAGNIGRVQGLDKVIENLPSDIDLHLYGTGAMENTLKKMNRQNVYFHGPYKRSEQIDILARCNMALITLEEGMYGLGVPSKSYNILASGRPILYLGPSGSEIALMIQEYGVGYCGWPQKWECEVLEEMGKKARELAVNKYSKQTILQKFVEII